MPHLHVPLREEHLNCLHDDARIALFTLQALSASEAQPYHDTAACSFLDWLWAPRGRVPLLWTCSVCKTVHFSTLGTWQAVHQSLGPAIQLIPKLSSDQHAALLPGCGAADLSC